MPRLALTRPVPPSIVRCELTHLARTPIDVDNAVRQHDAYEAALRSLGCAVTRLAGASDQPDSVFIEDTALVLDEVAVITRPGAASRRGETRVVDEALRPHRRVVRIEAPDTLDGGDVLRVGRTLYAGLSTRTTAAGAAQLRALLAPFGYHVETAVVRDALHLKSAASALPDGRVLINPRMVDASAFGGARTIDVDAGEPCGANVLCVGTTVICPAAAPRTRARLDALGYSTLSVDASELAKAEGGLTCCSLLFEAAD